MNYTEIEMEGMKEILRDKEEEIKKLKSDLSLVIKERDDNIKVNEFFKKTNSELGNVIEGLKEQNKKLNEYNRRLKQGNDDLKEQNKKLSEKNGQLKSDLAFERTMLDNVKAEYESSQDVIKELEERIRFLEQCLDNKEKVNKSLREENKKLKEERDDYMMKYANAMKDKVLECNKLATERNKLREENKRLSDFLECES